MTRLLFLAACIASAFATYDSSYGGNMGGSMMNSGASDKNAMDKSGSMMNEGANQKNAMDMSSGSSSATVDISVTVISSYKGGNAPMEQISQPTMAKGMTHMVTVGGDAGLVFSPSSINAAPGDMVHFTFMSQNHTLTQSTFPKPCVKMQGGVDSGFLPNPNNTISPPPTYMFQVKDMKPSWFYCKQKKPAVHCGKGMTFSINPTADKTQDMFMQMAMQQNGTAADTMSMGGSSSMMMPSTSMAMPPPPASSPPPAASSPPAAMPPAAAPPMPAPPPPPPPAAAPPPAMPPAAAPAMPAPPPPQNQNLAAAGASMSQGTGTMSNGQCSCSCLCGVAAFPAGAGVGMYGGYSGAVAMS
ncbi:MAG: hypothetical protein Q9203_005994 [Teloschistes exilis]